ALQSERGSTSVLQRCRQAEPVLTYKARQPRCVHWTHAALRPPPELPMPAAALAPRSLKPRTWLLALLLCGLLLACSLGSRTPSATHSVPVVQNFDVSRYAGPWYVLARTDHPSEAGLVQTGVYYHSNQDGSLNMVQ